MQSLCLAHEDISGHHTICTEVENLWTDFIPVQKPLIFRSAGQEVRNDVNSLLIAQNKFVGSLATYE